MPQKKPTKRKNLRRKIIKSAPRLTGYAAWVQRRAVVYDGEVWEESAHSYQTCLNCYLTFQIDHSLKFDIRNRFCNSCRAALPFKKWLLLRKFYRVLEVALNRREPDKDITKGAVMQYVNGIYQSIRNNMPREFLLDTMSCTVEVAHLASPIELSQLMEVYDQVIAPKKKRRFSKKRHLQKRKKNV